jgi:glyoxylase-like metal-dependent hydrolase (beta-lactamase superfamily II)
MSETVQAKPMREEQRPARDGVEEVVPGILRLQLPISFPGLGHVNCYILEDSRGVALIDPGLPGIRTWRNLKRSLKGAGIPISRVHTVVVTHSHPDHFGQVPRFKKATGAEIISHRSFRTFLDPEAEADDEALTTTVEPELSAAQSPTPSASPGCGHDHGVPDPNDGLDQPTDGQTKREPANPFPAVTPWGGKPYELPISRRIRYRAIRMAAGRFIATPRPTRRVDDADVLELGGREWVSVHTPGHTEDHLCLWDPNAGVMISGDHVLPTITPHISGLSTSADPLAQFFDSLDRMKTFAGVTAVLPAHGLVFDDLAGRADAISRHHHDRLDQLKRAGARLGQATVEQYMKELFKPRSWGPMAESETYAHLEHLKFCNEADTHDDGSQLRYTMRD